MSWFKSIATDLKALGRKTKLSSAKGGGDEISMQLLEDGTKAVLDLKGHWQASAIGKIDGEMRGFGQKYSNQTLVINFAHIKNLDTAGAWVIQRLLKTLKTKKCDTELQNCSADFFRLLQAVDGDFEVEKPKNESHAFGMKFLESTGKVVFDTKNDLVLGLNIIGAMLRGSQLKSNKKARSKFTSVIAHIYKMAVTGAPIVILMSFLIGGIITQQSAFYLKYFGAELLTVDLVGILVLREIGVILTAIMVAGRTGSSMTAEIGSMKMREEVDALIVIGLNPISVLIWPRIVALIIALPLLTILANFTAILGAIVVSSLYINITPSAFIDRLHEAITISTILAGLIKTPIMAIVIGIVAAIEGVKVGGSAESLGRRVTSAVVKAIFVVILIDGFFAIFYGIIGY